MNFKTLASIAICAACADPCSAQATVEIESSASVSAVAGNGGPTAVSTRFESNNAGTSKLTHTDARGTLQIDQTPEATILLAKDPTGTILYSGPFKTEADREAVPADVRSRAETAMTRSTAQRDMARARAAAVRGTGGGGGGGSGTLVVGGSGIESIASTNSTSGAGSKMVSKDASGTVEISSENGLKSAVTTGPDGAILFSGPLNTDAERALVPAAELSRIEGLEKRVVVRRAEAGLPTP